MDDCLAQVAIDFGGRNWIVWEAEFQARNDRQNADRNVFSFFQIVFRQSAVQFKYQSEGTNEHHKIEAIFKAFAKAIKMAVGAILSDALPSHQRNLPSTQRNFYLLVKKIAIVKYNAGNVESVKNALNRLGVEPILTDDAGNFKTADKVIFPGVGEASSAMNYSARKKFGRND
jgi:hypothetical protein